MQDVHICHAINAVAARGGQGEFLRQMAYALDQFPNARILSRHASAARAECVDVPFQGWRHAWFRAIQRTPVLRRRHDLLTLLSDMDFDSRLGAHMGDVNLFDGVMGQCCRTFELLSRKRVPLVLTALNTHIDHLSSVLADEHRRLSIPVHTFIHPRMQQRVHREVERASRIRAASQQAKQSYVERGVKPERIDVVLPAVDLDYFRPTAKKDAVFRVLAVLTIDPRKGVYYLLQAFEKAAIPGSELVIIGATGDRWSRHMLQLFQARLKNLRVRTADVLKDPIETTYAPASVLVHPAIEDGFGLVIAQALACGKPVIATRQSGASELITDAENGFVLESRDVDGLVDRLRLLARDESLLARFTAAAPKAVAGLGYPAFAKNVASFYRRVLDN
jgi:glycosyltransferase involved in cell wall biosynthesis